MILELLLGQYIFPISNQFYKKQYLPNVGFEYQVNIEIVYWPNIWSINFATWEAWTPIAQTKVNKIQLKMI